MKNTMDTPYQSVCVSLKSLNIIDFEERCQRNLYLTKPKKQKAFWFLKSLAVHNKILMDRNGVDCDIIDPTFRFLKDLPLSLVLENSAHNLKYMYFKDTLLSFLKDNTIFDEYAAFIRRTVRVPSSTAKVEMLLRKYLRVYNLLHVRPELSVWEVHYYELAAELLKLSYDANVQNSQLVVALLKMAIDMYVNGILTRHVRQPIYTDGFLKYVLGHSSREHFDLQCYCIQHPRTLWEFSRKLSVIHAVSVGNVKRTRCLLQHGIEVFPEIEMDKASQRFPFIAANMHRTYLMALHMLSRIKSVNDLIQKSSQTPHHDFDTATKCQKECFRLVWRSTPDPLVKYVELELAIPTEFLYFALREMENPVPYEKNTALCDFYEACFEDMAVGPNEPRSLKHLSRCTVRRTLDRSLQLPDGIFQLGLPCLEDYLNLECD